VIKWGYCPETWRTPYVEVQKTMPGQHIIIERDGRILHKITDPLWRADRPFQELKGLVEAAVKRRVQSSDVPVAVLLSGGLDSAITYTLARRYGKVHAYHAQNDELDNFHKVLGNAQWNFIGLDGVSLETAADWMQEPIDLGSLIPQAALSRGIAGCGAERVCLTGDGADELFGGYGRAARYDSQASDVWHELVAWHLPRLDRVMMRNRIEVRSPFLARDVASFALSLPRVMRTGKSILRSLFRDDLPKGVADVPKKPLRTIRVELNREARSLDLVRMFKEKVWPQ
jgi:asparagine synthase (glutamine-hydrolysing)